MNYLKVCIVFLLVIGCNEKSTNTATSFKLSGKVYYEGAPAQDVLIRVDESPAYTTTTDQAGYFEFNNLEQGSHSLNIYKEVTEDAYSTITIPVELNQDIYFSQLLLPKGVQILPPEDITGSSMLLKWTATDAVDFREYKIYQHETSGLDETTGTLIHVSTSIDDTVFIAVSLAPFNTYYFRVYVMNEYGKLGGSNIVSGKTQNVNLIVNGGFEIIDPYTNFAEGWKLSSMPSTYAEIAQTQSFEGNNSLHFYGIQGQYAFSSIDTDIDPNLLIPDKKYELTMWVKHDSLAVYHTGWIDLFPDLSRLYQIDGPKKISDWMQHKKIFYTPANLAGTYYGFQFHFAQIVKEIVPDLPLNIWIDNIEIKRVD